MECLPFEIVCIIASHLSPVDVVSFATCCKGFLDVVPRSLRQLQMENRRLCALSDKVGVGCATRLIFPVIGFAFLPKDANDRIIINKLNNMVERAARARLGTLAKPRTLGNPAHWDKMKTPVKTNMMDFFLQQFGFGVTLNDITEILKQEDQIMHFAGDAGHALVFRNGRLVLLGFVNLNEWGRSQFI